MKQIKLDYLEVDEAIETAVDGYEQGVELEEVIKLAYIQGMIDMKLSEMNSDDECVCDNIDYSSPDYIKCDLMTFNEWAVSDCGDYYI